MPQGKRPSRRTILRGVFAITGLAGSAMAAKLAPFGDDDEPAALARITPGRPAASPGPLFLSTYTLHASGRSSERHKGDQSLLRGTLLHEDGTKAGELFSSAITMPGPVDEDSPRTPRMEMQNLILNDGAIFAMGTVFAQDDIPNVYTILGGTGRYAVTRGTYTFDDNPNVARPSSRAAIRFDLTI